MQHEVQVIGTDPGVVWHGICHLSFWGHKLIKDEKEEWVKVPLFKILNWGLLDLKRTITYYKSPNSASVVINRYGEPNGNKPVDDLLHLGNNVSRFTANEEWIYTPYRSLLFNNGEEDVLPPIVTELQCGFIKNHELDVVMVSHILPWAIKNVDRAKGIESREVLNRARKYGFANDGELDYNERKAKSEEITRNLLKLTGMTKELNFLNALMAARKRDIPNSKKPMQCHDVCDAFLLALEECQTRHAALLKAARITPLVPQEEKPLKSLEITIDDDEEPKKKTLSLKKRAKAVNDGFEEHAKKKAVTVPKRQKKRRVSDDADTISLDDPVVLSPKKRKKMPVEEKYHQLELEFL